jgi:hypothetical protein
VVTQVSTLAGGSTVVVMSTIASTATGTTDSDNASKSTSNGGLIGGVVGGVVGGLALLTALILILVLWRRRKSRTGHGWFLCFGTRPMRGSKDFDVDWPTFDPTSGAAGVGGTMGNQSGRRNNQGVGGTLPEVDDGTNYDQYHNDEDMREVGYSVGQHTNGPSDEGHYLNGGWAGAGAGVGVGAASAGAATLHSSNGNDTAPTYDHLDPPEVRQARAREMAEAQNMAAYGGASQSPNSPPMAQQYSPGYYPTSSSSPPINDYQREPSNHRLSTGTTQALAANHYFDGDQDADSGTIQNNQQRMLHLHNPDA